MKNFLSPSFCILGFTLLLATASAQSSEPDPCDYQSLSTLRSALNDAAEAFAPSTLADAIESAREMQTKCPESSDRIQGFIEAAERRRAKLNATEYPDPVALRLHDTADRANPGSLLRTSLILSTLGFSIATAGSIAAFQLGEPNLAEVGGIVGGGFVLTGLAFHFRAAGALEREIEALKNEQ